MFIFLTVIQALVAAALVATILVQKSEGGGLGGGNNPSGLMSARGTADFLTRATAVLAGLFVLLSIVLAALAVKMGGSEAIDTSLNRPVPAAAAPASAPPAAQPAPAQPAPAPQASKTATPASSAPAQPLDPLANALKK